ncbi:MAG: molybdopterin molybdotransferase MoeA [Treponemataceae bacterium]
MEQIDLEQAQSLLIEKTNLIKKIETKNILDSLGFVLAQDIFSPLDNPPFNRSPLDGFTFKSTDTQGATKHTPVTFSVIKEIFAGDFCTQSLQKGEAFRIMTGAPIPSGCDCVIMQEEVCFDKKTKLLEVPRELKTFENICFLGEDVKKNQLIAKKNALITYNHIGVFASLGIHEVNVFCKPKVGILSLGSELTMPSTPLKEGKIYNSNLFTLASKLKYLGCTSIIYPPLDDDEKIVSAFIEKELPFIDFLITTGGVSVGKKDIMHEVITQLGAKRLFWKINMQPGTPVLASTKNDKIILSLSGNPFASLVNFELLARPILSKMSFGAIKATKKISACVKGSFDKKSYSRRFIRGQYSDGTVFISNEKNSSGVISSLIGKNAIVEIPAGTLRLQEGEYTQVILID